MQFIEYKKHLICYNWYNFDYNKNLRDFIEIKRYIEILDSMKSNTILVLWGDWAMLTAIKKHYDKWYPFLWINFWRKGFLLNNREYLSKKKEYIERTYPLLEIQTETDWSTIKEIAMNEIDIRAWAWKMIWLDFSLSKNQKLCIEWDWVIISTPAGSTGYNSSLWGPIIPHIIDAFVITPKASWKPKFQPAIIIDNREFIEVINNWRKNSVEIYCDWRLFLSTEKNTQISLKIKKSLHSIKLIIIKDYVDIWDNKVLQEQWFEIV